MSLNIEKIFIDEKVIDEPLTQKIMRLSSRIPYEVIKGGFLENSLENISISKSKKILHVTSQKGEMVKSCPGTLSPYLCCQYTVINQMIQCPLDCTYCILQEYLKSTAITIYTNICDIFQSVGNLLNEYPARLFRFGTGELTDSLVLDDITELSIDFIRFFSGKKNCILELKTKTNNMKNIKDYGVKNVVISWSVNPQEIIKYEEFNTSSILERLEAAKKCQDAGYLFGFHFDPVLFVPDWEVLYYDLIQNIFDNIDGSRIAWISIGSLRYPPGLKEIIQKRFHKSKIVYQEMIRGMDGKMRYPKPMRVEMYKKICKWIKEKEPDVFIYFCMESPEVWDRVMGEHPESNSELDYWFARSLWTRYKELDIDEPVKENYI